MQLKKKYWNENLNTKNLTSTPCRFSHSVVLVHSHCMVAHVELTTVANKCIALRVGAITDRTMTREFRSGEYPDD